MEQIRQAMNKMISISEAELNEFLGQAITKTFNRQEIISRPNAIPNEIFFINKGLIRVLITDNVGTEHTIHFALENQFIADYSNYIQNNPPFTACRLLKKHK
jgi:CRP-like cAMP-binding protein